ncbi:isochorismatase domain-containing protein 2 isoform X3 [Mauremys reevesii]|uniref:isochorismatase domain-containing protein 2 isoform X3 n=1 Tax=Mauremys reevesii TaxID=260615 RepID=UPI00193FFFF9|nr:isochorismatase domain-containing protein 2 isoform X3 [Mauremys reevesii]
MGPGAFPVQGASAPHLVPSSHLLAAGAEMALARLGKVVPKTSILFLCDMQEKFRPTIAHFPQIVAVAARMLQAAQLLEIPVVVTEQYPQGLGPTVPELGAEGLRKFPKTCFSMLVPEVEQELGALPHLRSVLLCGIETQACIMPSGPAGGPVPPTAERCLHHHQRGADPAAGQRRRPPSLPTDPEAH